MKLKGLLGKDTLWYFLAVAGLFLLLYLRRNFIIDTYIYALSLSTPIFILSYMLLKRIDALRYYLHATGCVFFVVWFSFYALNVARSKSVGGHLTEYIGVEHYTPMEEKAGQVVAVFDVSIKGSLYNSQQHQHQKSFIEYMVTLLLIT